MNATAWSFCCPDCQKPLPGDSASVDPLVCSACSQSFRNENGIWQLMNQKRLGSFQPFLVDYIRIRLAEGRGSETADYYLKLPDCDPGHPIAWQWRLRQRTFAKFQTVVLPELANPSRVLDVGAGVGWLSNRLKHWGHHVCSVDVCVDDMDGLGAAAHYSPNWPRVQAEFDRLPLPNGSVDAVIFNASLHYSTNYSTTLGEALRVLRPKGIVVILESPIYRREASGCLMVQQRHQEFERRFGTRSDSLQSIQYLTYDRLKTLSSEFDLDWTIEKPWYGWKWAIRPWKARLKRQREPSQFAILIGRQR